MCNIVPHDTCRTLPSLPTCFALSCACAGQILNAFVSPLASGVVRCGGHRGDGESDVLVGERPSGVLSRDGSRSHKSRAVIHTWRVARPLEVSYDLNPAAVLHGSILYCLKATLQRGLCCAKLVLAIFASDHYRVDNRLARSAARGLLAERRVQGTCRCSRAGHQ